MLNWFNMNKHSLSQQVLDNEKEIEKLNKLVENGEIESIENVGTSQGDGFTITHIKVVFYDGREEFFDIYAETLGSNPNILINGDFRVNQKGLSSYVAGGSSKKVYCVDMFYLTWLSELASINQDSISLKFVRQYGSFGQLIEDFEKYKGKEVTLSVKVKNNTNPANLYLSISDGVMDLSQQINGDGIFSKTLTVSENATKLQCIIFNTATTGVEVTLDLCYMKLELGKNYTPNNPRPYAEELEMCKRYYLKYQQSTATIDNPAFIGLFFATSTTGGFALIDLPTSIRNTFTITGNVGYKIGSSDTVNFTANSYAMITNNHTKLKLYCGGGSGLTPGSVYPLCVYGDDLKLEIDANL